MSKYNSMSFLPQHLESPGYIPLNGLSVAQKVYEEVQARRAEIGPQRPVQSFTEPTGSRKRIRKEQPCGKCKQMLTVGSSFRLRRVNNARMVVTHVSC